MARHSILQKYDSLRKAAKDSLYSIEIKGLLDEIFLESITFLKNLKIVPLISNVEGKSYFAFDIGKKISRAVNKDLYDPDYSKWKNLLGAMDDNDLSNISKIDIEKILYTIAISFYSCIDLIKDGDQKTPGTFFEYFIAYFFTWRVGTEPQKSIKILSIDEEDTKLPTDFIYNLGPKRIKFHMPIKTSTR